MDGSYPIRGGRPYRRGSGDGRGRGHEQGRGARGGRGNERSRGERGGRGHGRGGGDRGGRGNERGGGQRGGRGRGGGGEHKIFSYSLPIEPLVDAKIIEEEDNVVMSLRSSQESNTVPPPRPGYGAQGRTIALWANYFRLETENSLDLHRYSVQVSGPDPKRAPPKRMIKRIIQLFIAEQGLETDVVTDFAGTILMQREFDFNPDGYTITFREREEDEPSENASRYTVRAQYTGRINSASLLDHSTSSNLSSLSGAKQETIQTLNILLGHFNKSQPQYTVLGKGRTYDTQASNQHRMSLGGGLEVIRGFIFSVRAATARTLVNVQIKSLAFYQLGPLVDVVKGFLAESGPATGALERFLKRLKVEVTHIVRSNRAGTRIPRIKTISGLANTRDGRSLDHPPRVAKSGAGAKAVEFFLRDQLAKPPETAKSGKGKGKASSAGPSKEPGDVTGRYITVADFFQQQYKINIVEPDLPVVNVGSVKDPSYLPLQVCHVVPGQPGRAMPTPSQTQQMIRFSVRTPGENAKHITTTGLQRLGLVPGNTHTQAFGVSIHPTMITVPGRILQAPQVRYGKNPAIRPSFASWNLQSTQLADPAILRTWTYLVISPEGRQTAWPTRDAFHAAMDQLAAKLEDLGITSPSYTAGQMINVRRDDPEGRINEAVRKFTARPDRRPQFVLVVLPSFDGTTIYNRVKQTCDVEYGLLHVCVVDNKFARANDQYLANVCLKINLKLGGRNHILDTARMGVIAEGKTMVVGVDVTHPSPGSAANAPSVAAVVASVDSTLAQWPATLGIQTARQEMVSALKDMFKTRLRLWQSHNNNSLPQNIIIYRDGVSEGQYQVVLDNELPAVRQACVDIYPANDTKANRPCVSIIIVGKRHHTRFYATTAEDADRSGNPPNGTVVDRGVTESRNWDFFLQAHSTIQGTARPAHYFVLLDEIFRASVIRPPFLSAADVLEDLTHNMCYLFGRATKAVSICPPAYYAGLACERARCYLANSFDPPASELSDTASTVSGKTDAVGSVEVHESVKDIMFYI